MVCGFTNMATLTKGQRLHKQIIFGFKKNELPRNNTHPGDYPERDEYEKIAKEYVMMRNMRDMRRRNRLRDWI